LRALRETVVRFGLERPVARLLVESGRLSATPTYVIGIFSGDIKLGEGSGSKILEAQRAVRTRPAHSSLSSYHTCLC
jgi:large subunit ribosomal protein L44